jgi:mannobiose 2-epimerase
MSNSPHLPNNETLGQQLRRYQVEVTQELTQNILPFYLNHAVDQEHGGFYGLIANDLTVSPNAPKGLIQNCRILWTFSLAYRRLGDPAYLTMAERAYHYLLQHFWDSASGGLYWLLDCRGQPLDPTKMVYGQAFGIYGLVEYYQATGQPDSLEQAITLFKLLEQHSYDPHHDGYFEDYRPDWTRRYGPSIDQVPAAKTMNSHLHLLEAYTNLLRTWADDSVRAALKRLLLVTLRHLIDPQTGHFNLHFDAAWQSQSNHFSYGHDIEGSWLLVEAAEVLGNADLCSQIKEIALKMAQVTYDEGRDADGGLFNEGNPGGMRDFNKEWWPQAEAMVGFLNAYQLSGQAHFLEASLQSWRFVQQYLIDRQHGEWFWGVARDGRPHNREKTGPWKAPYHNGRACLEVRQRLAQWLHA